MSPFRLLTALALAAAALATPHAAFAANLKTAASACRVGEDVKRYSDDERESGETPLAIDGAITVTSPEARCMMKKLGKELIVIAAVDDERKIPGAIAMRWAAGAEAGVQAKLADALAGLTEGRKARPLLVYCHHLKCGLSQQVAARASKAGYTNIYWLRWGMLGWKQAGYGFQGETEDDPAVRYARLLEICTAGASTEAIAKGAATMPMNELDFELGKWLKGEQKNRKACLQSILPEVEDHKGRKADLAQKIARSDADAVRSLKAARAAFDSKPAEYLVPVLSQAPVSTLRKMVERARAVKPLSSCGSFDYQAPDMNNTALENMNQRLRTYHACLDRLVAQDAAAPSLDADEFGKYVLMAELTQPYTCSAKRMPHCVPDEVWARLGRVATRDQERLVENAAQLEEGLEQQVDKVRSRLNEFVDATNARVSRFEAQAQEEEDRRSNSGYGGGYSYTPPAPPPVQYRQPSNVSAAGIR
ncbi:rhodanese-like domain-containing protein [Massilia sp. DD77]|uniref:rhodanese-like domain-containing protein n=1 Tax=Massilia sp. DD77 TaxID=3109349 RepID=UPI002FFFD3B0